MIDLVAALDRMPRVIFSLLRQGMPVLFGIVFALAMLRALARGVSR